MFYFGMIWEWNKYLGRLLYDIHVYINYVQVFMFWFVLERLRPVSREWTGSQCLGPISRWRLHEIWIGKWTYIYQPIDRKVGTFLAFFWGGGTYNCTYLWWYPVNVHFMLHGLNDNHPQTHYLLMYSEYNSERVSFTSWLTDQSLWVVRLLYIIILIQRELQATAVEETFY